MGIRSGSRTLKALEMAFHNRGVLSLLVSKRTFGTDGFEFNIPLTLSSLTCSTLDGTYPEAQAVILLTSRPAC